MKRTQATSSDSYIKYNIQELNSLVSLILSSCIENGELNMQDANAAKEVFNTLMDMVVNEQEVADRFLEELAMWKEEYGVAYDSDDPISVAEKMAAQATELYNSEHNYEKNKAAVAECLVQEDTDNNKPEVFS